MQKSTEERLLFGQKYGQLYGCCTKARISSSSRNILIDIDMLDKYMPQQVVLVTTGSQGEPMSALSRMAYSDHRKVMVGEGDFIIISANPIPGNEKTVGNVVDELLKRVVR